MLLILWKSQLKFSVFPKMSLRGKASSVFYTHITKTLSMFVQNSVKMHLVTWQLLGLQVLLSSFFISIIHAKKNLIKMLKKNWESEFFFFALNILNEAEYLVCAQIKWQKCEYLLKRPYTTCHTTTQFHSIMGYVLAI